MDTAITKGESRSLSVRISSGFKKAGLSDSAVFATDEQRHWIIQFGHRVRACIRARLIPLSIAHTELLVRFTTLLLLSSLFLVAVPPAHADGNCPILIGPTDQTDNDGDGVGNLCDNCLSVSNTDQRDTNADGFGNICDADLNQDLLVNLSDFVLFRSVFGTTDPDADFDGNGLVNLSDYVIFRAMFGLAPGPSGLTPKLDNIRPLADAGPDQVVSVGATVKLDASATTDPDGGPLGYLWILTATPIDSTAVLSDANALMPELTADQAGDYDVTLTVFDGTATSAPDTVTISTVNVSPVAHAGLNQSANISDIITLDGSASTDVDGDPLTYLWSLDAIPASSGAMLSDPTAIQPTFQVDLLGEYVVSLIVNDGSANSEPDTTTITTGNTPPVADAGLDQSVAVTSLVQLDGTGSSDANSDPLTYLWSLPSIPAGSTTSLDNPALLSPSFTADIPGTYIGQLIVNDATADSEPDTVVFTTDNVRPVANAGQDQTGVFVGDTVLLDGSGSSDAEGMPLGFRWALIKRPSGSAAALSGSAIATPSFVPDVPGMYIVQLIVDDTVLDSAPDIAVVTTTKRPPVLNAAISPTTDNPYLITGTATAGASVDIYIKGALQHQITSDPMTGLFSVEVYLFDGINDIYAVENDGFNISPASNTLLVQYDNVIDRNNIPTTIGQDTVWTAGETSQPYIISTKTYVSSSSKLIIQPGVTVIFEGYGAELRVNGDLIIRGSEDNKVVLTASSQVSGQGWDGIFVSNNGSVSIDHAVIEYANSRNFVGPVDGYYIRQSAIFFSPGSQGIVSNTLIQQNRTGIKFYGDTSPTIGPGNTITLNNIGLEVNVAYDINPTPIINANKIFNNTSFNLDAHAVTASATVNARGNYWGSTNASEITSTVIGGIYPGYSVIDISDFLDVNGDVVPTGNVLQGYISIDTPLLANTTYEVRGNLAIEAGATLTIPKGTTLKFTSGAGLTVYGDLIVQGIQSEPVVFTSGRDSPTYSNWSAIDIKNSGNVNVDYAVIEYANTGIYFREGSNGTVSNTTIRNNIEGVHVQASSPTIGPDNIITQNGLNQGGGIRLSRGSIDPEPIIKNNQIFDNRTNLLKGSFVGGRNITVDVRGNYWGSVNAAEIAVTISNCVSNNSGEPCVDYGGYLDANGNVVGGLSLIGVVQSDLILQANTTYEVLGYVLVPAGVTLTIPQGVKLVFVSLYDNMDILGNFNVTGTQINPVVFTSGQVIPKEGARSYPGDWNGISVNNTGFLSMEYAVIQYPDTGISFSSVSSGNISNSVIEYAGTGVSFYNSINVNMSNNLLRFNGTALDITGSSSPVIGPGNTIKQNDNGIYLRQLSNLNPTPSISGNYIFSNNTYNINVNNFVGGNAVTIDVRGNYWGTDDPDTIALKMNQSSTSYPVIDFSNFILTADVPPGTGSSPVAQELQACPIIRVTDDDNFFDKYPDNDIAWTGNNFTDVQEIEKAFNYARLIDKSIFQYLKMPSQAEWDAMTVQAQGLYLINSERQARGIKPYEGISQNVVTVAQNYSDFLRTNNQPIGHYQDGKSPLIRLNEDPVISGNSDTGIYPESIYGQSGSNPVGSNKEVVVDAIYRWIYADKSGGNNWGHRDHIIQTGLNENSGETYKEGLIGFGISIGDYDPTLSLPGSVGAVVVMNSIDPSSTWDHSTTQTIDTDAAQLCNNNIAIHIDETSVFAVNQIEALEISPSDIFLTPGATAQLRVIATYQDPIAPQDITSTASFAADSLSVVNIDAGYITALQNGDVYAVASVNGVTSNRIFISVRDKTDTSNLNGTYAEDYLTYVPDNATLDHYDPKAFGVFTGLVKDKVGAPLSDVTISIHNKPEYGSVITDANGRFIIAAQAGTQKIVYRKAGYLTLHRRAAAASNNWAVADEAMMLEVDSKQTAISLSITTPQIHKSTVVTDAFGSRTTTLVFNGITSAVVTTPDGSQRSLSDFFVRATEYELPQSMPAALPKESAFTYCSELQIPTLRDDETVTFDNPVVMYVDNFLGFNVGEIVPIGYYDRNLGEWVASNNGIVVKLLDANNDGAVDGLDFTGDDIADDVNQNGSTDDEVTGIETYPVGSTYWRGSFDHFTPYDFNWPYKPADGAVGRGEFIAEISNENKEQKELECTGSYVKPETRSFHEDIEIAGTNLTLHYSSQRTAGYKHKFNVKVTGDTVPAPMLEMLVKLEIGGNVYQQSFAPEINKEAEFMWDGTDPTGKRIEGAVNGIISIGYRYGVEYVSAGTINSPMEFADYLTAWAKVGSPTGIIGGRDSFITWSSRAISVQNTLPNQLAEGWSLSNHNFKSPLGQIYLGNGEVVDTNKSSLILKTGITTSVYDGDDGYYRKGGSEINYSVTNQGTVVDTVTGLEWQYTEFPQKHTEILWATTYCLTAPFTEDKERWRLPTDKEITYTVDKSGNEHYLEIYNLASIDNIWNTTNNNPDEKNLPIYCVRGEKLNLRYVQDLKRDNTREVVIDEVNGLMWQDDAATIGTKFRWTNSINYCEDLLHAGYDDWRLPNINELAYTLPNSVFQYQTTYPTEQTWGPDSPDRNPYWSSTPYAGFTGRSWAMESHGNSSPVFRTTDLYNVRCVRDNIELAQESYSFDTSGRHLETLDLATGVTLQTFVYGSDGLLSTIRDRFGDEITITRNSGYLQISTSDGYTTTVDINSNNEIISIEYDDNTKYIFSYAAGTLLETKTEPNGNIFTHVFNPVDGRVIQTSDQEGGVWDFYNTRQGNQSALYGYTTAEQNNYQTLRTLLDNGDADKITTLFDGTVLSDLNQADDLKQTLQSCAVTTVIDKVVDSKTRLPIPSQITITQPSGLQSITQLTKIYGEGGADITQQTLTVDLNGKTSTVFTDTATGVTTATSAENRTTTLNVDPVTLLLQSSQAPGLFDTTYTYDTRGRQKTITTGTRTTTFTYNPLSKGDVTFITADDGKKTEFEYDALGRVKTIIYPDLHRTENIYDNNGNMKTLIVPTPANHAFTYNSVNKVKTETTPKDGVITEVTQYDYDTERNLKQITLPSTKIITNTYTNGLLDFTSTPEGIIDYAYTCNGKVSGITEGTESIAYGYDGSLLTSIDYLGTLNKIITQTYNNDFNIATLNYAGQITNFGYDKDGLLTSTNGYTITRNPLNGLPETVANGTLLQTRGFNGYGEAETVTTKVSNQNLYDYTLGYNDLGKIASKTETLDNGTVNSYVYNYDDRRRLDTVTKNGVLIEDYGYDANGNRTLQTNTARGITAQSASYNLGDQLQSDGATSYEYDSDGYLSKKTTTSGITTYQYSSQGRLLQVQTPSKTITYQHNALGNRVAKLVDGVVTEKYLWLDKTTLLATYDATDTLLQRYQYTDGNTPNSFTQGGQMYYIVTDHLGTPRAITDAAGTIVKKLDYDSFGNVISDSNPGFSIPFGFAGGLQDNDTGLIRFGFRDYDADTGRWTARDPIGFSGGDTNLYGYVFNDPIDFTDPTGLAYSPRGEHGISSEGNSCGGGISDEELNAIADLLIAFDIANTPFSPLPEASLIGLGIKSAIGNTAKGKIKGYTRHGLNQAIGRDGGRGVSAKAIKDAVKKPKKITNQSGGRTKYKGENATVILNKNGKVITTFGQPRNPGL